MNFKAPLSAATLFLLITCISCTEKAEIKDESAALPIVGTWQLFQGTSYENGDTTVTDYGKTNEMIKILNDTHFSFLNHDLNHGKDSTASFVAGGGTYSLEGNTYTEHLDYCNYREYEGNTFEFELTLQGDTLIQKGREQIEEEGIDRIIIEKYIRIK